MDVFATGRRYLDGLGRSHGSDSQGLAIGADAQHVPWMYSRTVTTGFARSALAPALCLVLPLSVASAQDAEPSLTGGATDREAPEVEVPESYRGPEVAEADPAQDFDLSFLDAIDEGEADAGLDLGLDEEDDPLVLPVFGATSFAVTSTTIAQYRRNDLERRGGFLEPEAGYSLTIIERLNLAMQGEELRLSTRIDGFFPITEPSCDFEGDPICELRLDIRPGTNPLPERLALEWTPGDVKLTLGDSYVVFGRGVSLGFRKVDLLGVDTTLRGGNFAYDGDAGYVRVIGGYANPQNLDPIDLSIDDDPEFDVVAGAAAGWRLDDHLTLGVHGARVWFAADDALGQDVEATVFGWSAELPDLFDGALVLYAEANAMLREDVEERLGAERHWGRAVYGQAQINAGDLSVILEWKDVRDFILAPENGTDARRVYSAMPSLDRDTERFRGIHNSRGGAATVTYSVPEEPWILTGQLFVYGHEDEFRERDPWDGILTAHGLLQVTKQAEDVDPDELGWAFDATLGYRSETYLSDEAPAVPGPSAGDLDWEVIHGEVDVAFALGDHGLELRVEQRFERRRFFDQVDYVRGGATLTYTFSTDLTLSPILLWNNERSTLPTFYPGIEARWAFTQESFLRLFAGQTPGGRLCSGGVCREVPPFEGGLVELVLRL